MVPYPKLLVHVKEVIDRGDLLSEDLSAKYLPDKSEDLSPIYHSKTWRGKIDGTGPRANGFA